MARTDNDEIARRLDEVETLMARRLSTSKVCQWAAAKYSITERQARKYVQKIRERWAAESSTVDRAAKRDQLRATAESIVAHALSRSEVVRDADGNPIVDPTTNRPLVREVPDLKTAIRGADVLARLDGLYQDKLRVEDARAPVVAVSSSRFAGRSREELTHFAQHGRFPDEASAATTH